MAAQKTTTLDTTIPGVQRWLDQIASFKARALARDGYDYDKDSDLARMLDGQVRMLAREPRNARRSGKWFLEQAHQEIMEAIRLVEASEAA